MSDVEMWPADGRWQCTKCGCFLAESATEWWDEADPGAHYGVAERYVVNCPQCGRLTDSDTLPPVWTPTRWEPAQWAVSDEQGPSGTEGPSDAARPADRQRTSKGSSK